MYVLLECGLIHKYLFKKEDIQRLEEETFYTVKIVKDLSDYKIIELDNKLILSNGAETLVFIKSDSKDKDFQYYLDEFNCDSIMPKVIAPDDMVKIDKQIRALKAIIPRDTSKDRKIHVQALKDLEEHKKKLEMGGILNAKSSNNKEGASRLSVYSRGNIKNIKEQYQYGVQAYKRR